MALFPAAGPLGPSLAALRGGLMQTEAPVASSKSVGRGGLMGFLDRGNAPGGFFDRLNTFGATLQDIDDGGNRAALIEQQQARAAQSQAQAEERQRIAQMGKELNLSPVDTLIFNANPDAFFRMLGEREADARRDARPTYLNTREGVYRTGVNPGWEVEFPDEAPEADFGWRYGENGALEPIPGGPADPAYIRRRGDAGRAPPRAAAPRRSSSSTTAPAASSRAPWQRSW